MIYGNMVSLYRRVIKKEEITQSVKQCLKYVEDLIKFQDRAIEVAQLRTENIQDSKLKKASVKANSSVKSFDISTLVMALRHGGSKLDLKWTVLYKVSRK